MANNNVKNTGIDWAETLKGELGLNKTKIVEKYGNVFSKLRGWLFVVSSTEPKLPDWRDNHFILFIRDLSESRELEPHATGNESVNDSAASDVPFAIGTPSKKKSKTIEIDLTRGMRGWLVLLLSFVLFATVFIYISYELGKAFGPRLINLDRIEPSYDVGTKWVDVGELSESRTIDGVRYGSSVLLHSNGQVNFAYRRATNPIPWLTSNAHPAVFRRISPIHISKIDSLHFEFSVHENGRIMHDIGFSTTDGFIVSDDIRISLRLKNALLVRIQQSDTTSLNSSINLLAIENGSERVVTQAMYPDGFIHGRKYSIDLNLSHEIRISTPGGSEVIRKFPPLLIDFREPMSSIFIRDFEGGLSNEVSWSDPREFRTVFENFVLTVSIPVGTQSKIALVRNF